MPRLHVIILPSRSFKKQSKRSQAVTLLRKLSPVPTRAILILGMAVKSLSKQTRANMSGTPK